MEVDNYSSVTREDDHRMELPPGFRFHPTDEELITHYLCKKVVNSNFAAIAIGEADLNKIEPWDLPSVAKMGEKEWYFFVVRDRKYPTGMRTNRATEKGYWKATGKDKEIYRASALVGMKKTLVFYTGRAPKGEKTNWVMHEFRLDGNSSKHDPSKNAENDWVISRVFKKISNEKRPNFAEFVAAEELHPPYLPPLMDSSPQIEAAAAVTANPGHVSCFSNPAAAAAVMGEVDHPKAPTKEEEFCMFGASSTSTDNTLAAIANLLLEPDMSSHQFMDSIFGPDQPMMKLLIEGNESNPYKEDLSTVDRSNHAIVNNLTSPFDHDLLWNY